MATADRLPPLAEEHVRVPRNPGRVPDPDHIGEATNPACGDRLILTVRLLDDVVAEARFLAEGCAATRAAGSLLTEVLVGMTRGEVLALDPATLDHHLGGLPPGRFHAAELACRAARVAFSTPPPGEAP